MISTVHRGFEKNKLIMSSRKQKLMLLYISVLVPILSEWINDEDLCFLYSAMCSQGLRNHFLRVLKQCSIVNTDIERCGSLFNSFKSWLLLRSIGLKTYSTEWKVDLEELKVLFKNKHIVHLQVHNVNQLDFLNVLSMSVESVTVKDKHWTTESVATIPIVCLMLFNPTTVHC